MILIYVFSGAMSIALDTTAGEKERGSLASLLVNQVSRTSIAMGKVMYVVFSGLLNAISSFAGLVLAFSLNSLLFGSGEMGSIQIFSLSNIIALLVSLLALAGIAASLFVYLGSLAKNLQQASGYISPIYILVIVAGVVTMQMDTTKNLVIYFIPVINSIFSLKDILLNQMSILSFSISIIVNVGFISLLIYATSKLFNTEKILNTVS
ncbi:ABC transporter permease subunit [Oceanotoga teriensis]|nr:ABC transporter permease subunit [Oceanotoga teriensis]